MRNQRVPKANLWIINYCILEIKADNALKISLSFRRRQSNPGPPTYVVKSLSITPRQLILKVVVKLIIFIAFAHEIPAIDAV